MRYSQTIHQTKRRILCAAALVFFAVTVFPQSASGSDDPAPSPLFQQSLETSVQRMNERDEGRAKPAPVKSTPRPVISQAGVADTSVRCIYELICMTGNADTLAMWGLQVGVRRSGEVCGNLDGCPAFVEFGVGSVCLTWKFAGCAWTNLPQMPIMANTADCDCEAAATMPGYPTCGTPTCANPTCEFIPSLCSPGGTCSEATCSSSGDPSCAGQGSTCDITQTCSGMGTCPGYHTCSGATCTSVATCGNQPTCGRISTCVVFPTCSARTTCDHSATCSAFMQTCGGQVTCDGACLSPTYPPQATCVMTCDGPTCLRVPTCGTAFSCNGSPTCATAPSCGGFIFCTPCHCPQQGDVNNDGRIDVGDVLALAYHLFGRSGAPYADPTCAHTDRGDLDCSQDHSILDVVRLVEHVFYGRSVICDPCTGQIRE